MRALLLRRGLAVVKQFATVGMAVAVVLMACAQAQAPAGQRGAADEAPRAVAVKRVAAAILGDAPALVQELNAFGQRGMDVLEELLLVGLTLEDNRGLLRPQLAEAVPTVENGLWEVQPDGRMRTTWRTKPGVRWHDGAPFTSADLLFAAQVGMDRDVPEFGDAAFGLVASVEAPDPQTITVVWRQPYIEADRMFGTRSFAGPMPRHILDRVYSENKGAFTQQPYWNEEFVGTGSFKLRQFVAGSHVVLEAYDGFVHGRPKIDVLEIRFFADPTAIVASLLGGGVELTLGKTLSVEQALEVRDQWREGRMEHGPSNAISVYPQMLTPNPVVIGSVQFRRALLHAINRQELADTLLFGLSSVAFSFMFPGQAQYREIEARLPRYEYDPRRATQMLDALGHTRAADSFYRDGRGQQLSVEIRSSTTDINQKAMFAIADAWQRVGVKVDPVVYSRQAGQSNEYLFTFPGFYLQRYTSDVSGLKNLHSSRTPLPENNFRSGNTARYMNTELDANLDRYFSTIPSQERIQVLGQILFHVADQLPHLGLFFDAEPTVMHSRLTNISARWPSSTQAWNAHEWDAK